MRITRRHLQISLGFLWLLDGALQCQPIMFGRGFAKHILAPAGAGLPGLLVEPLHDAIRIALAQPVLANATFALIQILLGLGLISRRFTRVALVSSMVWALSVWVAGEGLGGLSAGSTLLTGAPGAALLYAVIAALAWPRSPLVDDRPSRWALPAWCALWLLGAGLQVLDGNNSPTSLTMMLRAAQSGAPGWVAQIDRDLVALHIPSWTASGVIALDVLIATWSLVPGWTQQLSLSIGMFTALTGWLLFRVLVISPLGRQPTRTPARSSSFLDSLWSVRTRTRSTIERMIPSRRVVLWTDRFLFRAVQSRYLTLDTPLTLWVFYWQGTQNIRGISVVLNEDGLVSIKSL